MFGKGHVASPKEQSSFERKAFWKIQNPDVALLPGIKLLLIIIRMNISNKTGDFIGPHASESWARIPYEHYDPFWIQTLGDNFQ